MAEYVPIELQSLQDVPLAFDLYINRGSRYLLYRGSSTSLRFTLEECRRLLASGVTHLWLRIPAEENTGPRRLMSLLALPDEHLPPPVKAQLWYGSAKATAQRAMKCALSPSTLADVRALVEVTVDYLLRSSTALPTLLFATIHDYTLHTHSVNVAVYALGIGKSMGAAGEEDLRNLGLAAFLHDVGKARVPKEVLFKPGPLSREEWAMIHQHPLWGTELLSKGGNLPERVLTIVAQHHERLDGSGYPQGLENGDLDLFSMIVAMTDAFDAMTSYRPYKPKQTPYAALSLLKKETEAGKLDSDLFVSLVLLLGDPRHGEDDEQGRPTASATFPDAKPLRYARPN